MKAIQMTLRHIAAISTSGDSNVQPCFLEKTTVGECIQAYKEFDAWWEGFVEKTLTSDQQDNAYYAIWGLISARDQYRYEAGFRDGMRLMQEAYSPPPSMLTIEHRAYASKEQKYDAV